MLSFVMAFSVLFTGVPLIAAPDTAAPEAASSATSWNFSFEQPHANSPATDGWIRVLASGVGGGGNAALPADTPSFTRAVPNPATLADGVVWGLTTPANQTVNQQPYGWNSRARGLGQEMTFVDPNGVTHTVPSTITNAWISQIQMRMEELPAGAYNIIVIHGDNPADSRTENMTVTVNGVNRGIFSSPYTLDYYQADFVYNVLVTNGELEMSFLSSARGAGPFNRSPIAAVMVTLFADHEGLINIIEAANALDTSAYPADRVAALEATVAAAQAALVRGGSNAVQAATQNEIDGWVNAIQNAITALSPAPVGLAILTSLTITGHVLTPSFSPFTHNYTLTVAGDVTVLDLSYTAFPGATAVVSGPVNELAVGTNTITVTVTAPNVATTVYTIAVLRRADLALASLVVEGGGEVLFLAPEFSPDIFSYAILVDYEVTELDITAVPLTPAYSAVVLIGNYDDLQVGANTITVRVQDIADPADYRDYTLVVTRPDALGLIPIAYWWEDFEHNSIQQLRWIVSGGTYHNNGATVGQSIVAHGANLGGGIIAPGPNSDPTSGLIGRYSAGGTGDRQTRLNFREPLVGVQEAHISFDWFPGVPVAAIGEVGIQNINDHRGRHFMTFFTIPAGHGVPAGVYFHVGSTLMSSGGIAGNSNRIPTIAVDENFLGTGDMWYRISVDFDFADETMDLLVTNAATEATILERNNIPFSQEDFVPNQIVGLNFNSSRVVNAGQTWNTFLDNVHVSAFGRPEGADPLPFGMPQNVIYSPVTEDSVTIQWEQMEADGFHIYRRHATDARNSLARIATVPGNVFRFVDANLGGPYYYYAVRAFSDESGTREYSPRTREAFIQLALGADDWTRVSYFNTAEIAGFGNRIRVGDLTGDGRMDILLVNTLTMSGGGGWVPPGTAADGGNSRVVFSLSAFDIEGNLLWQRSADTDEGYGMTGFTGYSRTVGTGADEPAQIADVTGDGFNNVILVANPGVLNDNAPPWANSFANEIANIPDFVMPTNYVNRFYQVAGDVFYILDGRTGDVAVDASGNLMRMTFEDILANNPDSGLTAGIMNTLHDHITLADLDGRGIRQHVVLSNRYSNITAFEMIDKDGNFVMNFMWRYTHAPGQGGIDTAPHYPAAFPLFHDRGDNRDWIIGNLNLIHPETGLQVWRVPNDIQTPQQQGTWAPGGTIALYGHTDSIQIADIFGTGDYAVVFGADGSGDRVFAMGRDGNFLWYWDDATEAQSINFGRYRTDADGLLLFGQDRRARAGGWMTEHDGLYFIGPNGETLFLEDSNFMGWLTSTLNARNWTGTFSTLGFAFNRNTTAIDAGVPYRIPSGFYDGYFNLLFGVYDTVGWSGSRFMIADLMGDAREELIAFTDRGHIEIFANGQQVAADGITGRPHPQPRNLANWTRYNVAYFTECFSTREAAQVHGIVSGNSVNITLVPIIFAEEYRLYKNDVLIRVFDPETDNLRYTVTGLTSNTVYQFTVTASATNNFGQFTTTLASEPFIVNRELGEIEFTATQIGGISGERNTTAIEIVFDRPVTGLVAEDIVVQELSGAGRIVRGALTGEGITWRLAVDDVLAEGQVRLFIANFDDFFVESGWVPVNVYTGDNDAQLMQWRFTFDQPNTTATPSWYRMLAASSGNSGTHPMGGPMHPYGVTTDELTFGALPQAGSNSRSRGHGRVIEIEDPRGGLVTLPAGVSNAWISSVDFRFDVPDGLYDIIVVYGDTGGNFGGNIEINGVLQNPANPGGNNIGVHFAYGVEVVDGYLRIRGTTGNSQIKAIIVSEYGWQWPTYVPYIPEFGVPNVVYTPVTTDSVTVVIEAMQADGFHIYRRYARDAATSLTRIATVMSNEHYSVSFVDANRVGPFYYYRVVAFRDNDGTMEYLQTRDAFIQLAIADADAWTEIANFRTVEAGLGNRIRLGDLTGDGRMDILLVNTLPMGGRNWPADGGPSGRTNFNAGSPNDQLNSRVVFSLSAYDIEGNLLWQNSAETGMQGFLGPSREISTGADEPAQIGDVTGDGFNNVVVVANPGRYVPDAPPWIDSVPDITRARPDFMLPTNYRNRFYQVQGDVLYILDGRTGEIALDVNGVPMYMPFATLEERYGSAINNLHQLHDHIVLADLDGRGHPGHIVLSARYDSVTAFEMINPAGEFVMRFMWQFTGPTHGANSAPHFPLATPLFADQGDNRDWVIANFNVLNPQTGVPLWQVPDPIVDANGNVVTNESGTIMRPRGHMDSIQVGDVFGTGEPIIIFGVDGTFDIMLAYTRDGEFLWMWDDVQELQSINLGRFRTDADGLMIFGQDRRNRGNWPAGHDGLFFVGPHGETAFLEESNFQGWLTSTLAVENWTGTFSTLGFGFNRNYHAILHGPPATDNNIPSGFYDGYFNLLFSVPDSADWTGSRFKTADLMGDSREELISFTDRGHLQIFANGVQTATDGITGRPHPQPAHLMNWTRYNVRAFSECFSGREPAQPIAMTPVVGGSFTITWIPIIFAESYNLYKNGTLVRTFDPLVDDLRYTVTGLSSSNVYQFTITASNTDPRGNRQTTIHSEPLIINRELGEVSFTVAQIDGVPGTVTTTAIEIVFDRPVTGLVAEDIVVRELVGGGRIARGVLTGSGTTWTLEVEDVLVEGEVNVFIPGFSNYFPTNSWTPVNVYKGDGTIVAVSVTITPDTATVPQGGTQAFTATVVGPENVNTAVIWTVTGNTSTETTISSDGVLTVADDEEAETLTVVATSVADPTAYDEVTVYVVPAFNGLGYVQDVAARLSAYIASITWGEGTTPQDVVDAAVAWMAANHAYIDVLGTVYDLYFDTFANPRTITGNLQIGFLRDSLFAYVIVDVEVPVPAAQLYVDDVAARASAYLAAREWPAGTTTQDVFDAAVAWINANHAYIPVVGTVADLYLDSSTEPRTITGLLPILFARDNLTANIVVNIELPELPLTPAQIHVNNVAARASAYLAARTWVSGTTAQDVFDAAVAWINSNHAYIPVVGTVDDLYTCETSGTITGNLQILFARDSLSANIVVNIEN